MATLQVAPGSSRAGALTCTPLRSALPKATCTPTHRVGRLSPVLPPRAPKRSHAPQVPQAEYAPQYGEQYDPTSFVSSSTEAPPAMPEAARKSLARATRAIKRYGWLSFWTQLSLSVVSGVILLFSVAFTSQSGPKASLYLTLVGILAGFLSTFWNFGYTRIARKMQAYLDAPPGMQPQKVKKQQVIDMTTKGAMINMVGLGSTLLGVQALVGLLVAKTLSNASANPFLATAAGNYNPVLALDVFLVQAAINTLLGHFVSLCCSLWLLNIVGEGKGLRFQRSLRLQRLKRELVGRIKKAGRFIKGNAGTYQVDSSAMEQAVASSGMQPAMAAAGAAVRAAPVATAASSSKRDDDWGGGSGGGGASTSSSSSSSSYSSARSMQTAMAAASSSSAETTAADSGAAEALARKRQRARYLPSRYVAQMRRQHFLAFPTARSLTYLTGALPGDQGFDPLGMFDPANDTMFMNQRWLRYSEVMHGRWAMLGALGCIAPEYLADRKLIPEDLGVDWFATGLLPNTGSSEAESDWRVLLSIYLVAIGSAEWARLKDFSRPDSEAKPSVSGTALLPSLPGYRAPYDPVYPGGELFDPLQLVDNPATLHDYQTAEVKHGRLAMIAMTGFAVQAAVTKEGPWDNLLQHALDPWGNNLFSEVRRDHGPVGTMVAQALGKWDAGVLASLPAGTEAVQL